MRRRSPPSALVWVVYAIGLAALVSEGDSLRLIDLGVLFGVPLLVFAPRFVWRAIKVVAVVAVALALLGVAIRLVIS